MSSCRRAVVSSFQSFAIILLTLSVISCGGSSSLKSEPVSQMAVAINPTAASMGAGQAQQFVATVTGGSSNSVTWTVDGPGTISKSGLYTAPSNLADNAIATVTATSTVSSSYKASCPVKLVPRTISISPASATVTSGSTEQFSAKITGTMNTAVTWSVSGPGSVSSSGLYTAPSNLSANTTATIRATSKAFSTLTTTATITVTPSQPISISPAAITIYASGSQQFAATFSGTATNAVTWSLSGPGTLSNSGLYNAPDTVNSSATATVTVISTVDTSMTASATITIDPQTITVSPATASVHPGDTTQFSAKLAGVSSKAISWTLSGPGQLSSSGLYTAPATATTAATATITAVSGTVKTLKAHATVKIEPETIGITPLSATLNPGGSMQFSAALTGLSDNNVDWSVSGPGSISKSGVYTAPTTASSTLTATVTATSRSVSTLQASATITVNPQTIAITPTSANLHPGASTQFSATLTGVSSNTVTWSVSGPGSISQSGMYTAPASVTSAASATITATSNAVSSLQASATVNISSQTISITPTSASLAAGATQQFGATVSGVSDNSVTWSVSGPGTISNSGLYTAPSTVTSAATATITATSNAVSGLQASATVSIAAQTISVTPKSANVTAGGTAQFAATLAGVSDQTVTWSVSGAGSISNSGLYTAPANASAGTTATITATSNAVSSLKTSATVTIAAQTISVSPTSANVNAGATQQFAATVSGVGDTSVTWSVSGGGTISNSGLYTAPANASAGATATITATSNAVSSLQASATVRIAAQTISLTPSSASLSAGGTTQFAANLSGVSSNTVNWTLSGPGTLSASGLYTAPATVSSGGTTATITATSTVVSSLTASATVTLKSATISMSPGSASIYENGTAQFAATVSGASDTSVTWSLSGPGTISNSGEYTAPSGITSTTTATVTATSNAVSSLTASATVTIKPSTISLSPTSSSITAGQTKQFTAQLTGVSSNSVNWTLSGSGTLSSSGMYTAPSSVSSTMTATITATSNADSTLSASATITVSPASSNPSGTAITACGQSLQANTTYYLANDIGSSGSSLCLTPIGPNLVLNLNGHKITGTLKAEAINVSGVHIYNGSITCQDDDPNQPGCLYIGADTDAPAISAPLEIDHISWINTSATSNNSERNLMIDLGGTTKTTLSGPNVLVHDNTSVSATGISSSRIVNLQVQGTAHSNIGYAAFYNNATLCQSTAAACQGVVAYGLWDVKVYNNTFVNQMANAASTETPRAVICDQTDACEIYSNVFDAEDGRAVRMRGTNNKNDVNSVHDNTVNNVVAGSNQNEVAAFHIGDPDSGTEVENATIYNNTINATTGWVFMARSATGITIRDNTVNTNTTVNLLDGRSVGASTQVDLFRTTLSGGTAQSFCESGVNVTVCKSGNVSGSCSLNNSGC